MDVAEQSDLKAYADRLEFICRAQKAEIAKLRAEVERLTAAGGAHSVLRNIYLDADQPAPLRAKAATAALVHEVPKLLPEWQALELVPQKDERPLGVIHAERLQRQIEVEARMVAELEHCNGDGDEPSETISVNGNGADDHD
jgi:hypothetical protein